MHLRYLTVFLLVYINSDAQVYSQTRTELTITALEQRRFEAMTHQDLPFLEQVLAENVTYAHSNGLVENKQQHIENIRTGNITYQEMNVEESHTDVYKKTAVTHGIVQVNGLYKGSPFHIRLGFTDVYVKQKRKWKLVAWRSVKLE